jgi:phage portal protein BeeE
MDIPVSHSGLQIKPLNLSKREDEFSKQREFIKTVLFQNWEMNQALFSQEPNRANIEGAQFGFALHTIEPNVVDIAGNLEFELERVFKADPDALRISPPDDIVPEDRETRASVDQTEIESGVTTINEVRERDGKEPVEGGEDSLVRGSVQPLWPAAGMG